MDCVSPCTALCSLDVRWIQNHRPPIIHPPRTKAESHTLRREIPLWSLKRWSGDKEEWENASLKFRYERVFVSKLGSIESRVILLLWSCKFSGDVLFMSFGLTGMSEKIWKMFCLAKNKCDSAITCMCGSVITGARQWNMNSSGGEIWFCRLLQHHCKKNQKQTSGTGWFAVST